MDAEVFAVLDGARLGNALPAACQLNAEHTSLYAGPQAALLAEVAPHLFRMPIGSVFSEWLFAEGWGHAWGIFCCTAADGVAVKRHLRRFLRVGLEGGKPFYLRFYDPRVLRRLLPSCDAGQLTEFFGPIDYFWVEDEDPNFGLYYWLAAATGALVTHRVSRAELEQTFR